LENSGTCHYTAVYLVTYKGRHDMRVKLKGKKGKVIPVTGCGGPYGCERLRLIFRH
jgi:hypothetical protein